MGRRLGGTNGIPDYHDRTYVCVLSSTERDGHVMPLEITWVDGRRYPIQAYTLERVVGRWDYGNVVMAWEVELVHHARRMLYWEGGRWFVPRRYCDRNGERALGEPAN